MPSPALSFKPIFNERGFPVEQRHCPAHFQERIDQVAGFNRYGLSNYRLVWAQTETVRRGGKWEAAGNTYTGYRDVLLGDGLPHWMLLQWVDRGKSAEMPHLPAQGPASFYQETKDPASGLQLLGEYPYQGSYQIVLPLVAKWFEDGKLRIAAYPLDTEIVESMIPIIRASMLLSAEAKVRYMEEVKEQEEIAKNKQFQDAYDDVRIPKHAYTKDWVWDKQRKIERAFNAAMLNKFRKNPVFQSDRPI